MHDDNKPGYCRPPRHTRFRAGQSGNPKGRPRGAKGLRAELKAELDERISITSDGKTRRLSKRRLIIKALAAKAAKGDVRAADKLLSLVIQAEGFEELRGPTMSLGSDEAGVLDAWLADRAEILERSESGIAEENSPKASSPSDG